MAKTPLKLGRVQLEIMQVLWRHGRATARQITDELSETKAIAHSTVQTLLRDLEAKKAVAHEQDQRTFWFRPLIQQSDVSTSATRDLLTRVFHGSVYGLVAHLLQNETVSEEELAQLRQLVDQQRANEEKQP